MEGTISEAAIQVVRVHPHALVFLGPFQAAAQRHTDRPGGLGCNSWSTDRGDIHAFADVASEDDLIISCIKAGNARYVSPTYEGSICLDNRPEGTEAPADKPVSCCLNLCCDSSRALSGLCVRCVQIFGHCEHHPRKSFWLSSEPTGP